MGIRTENHLVYPPVLGRLFWSSRPFINVQNKCTDWGWKSLFFLFVLPVRNRTWVIYHPACQSGTEVAFLRRQHFFKSTKICHLCDAPSHQTAQPYVNDPNTACPDTGKPDMDNPCLENRPQLNKDKRNTDSSSTKGSNPILSGPRRCQLNRTIEQCERYRDSFWERVCCWSDVGQHRLKHCMVCHLGKQSFWAAVHYSLFPKVWELGLKTAGKSSETVFLHKVRDFPYGLENIFYRGRIIEYYFSGNKERQDCCHLIVLFLWTKCLEIRLPSYLLLSLEIALLEFS